MQADAGSFQPSGRHRQLLLQVLTLRHERFELRLLICVRVLRVLGGADHLGEPQSSPQRSGAAANALASSRVQTSL